MTSKQINFFITPGDIPQIVAFFEKNHCLVFKGKVKNKTDDLNYDILTNPQKLIQVYLVNRDFKNTMNFGHLETINQYYIDIVHSSCIEFDIGGFYPYSDKVLHRSRFYYVSAYYDKETLVKKNDRFIHWAEGLIKDFKSEFLLKSGTPDKLLLSESCVHWIEEFHPELTTDGSKFILV